MNPNANTSQDITLIEQGSIKLGIYGIQKLASKNSQVVAANVEAQLKAALKGINLVVPISISQLLVAIFSFLKGLTNITQSNSVQAIEQLMGDVYSAFTTGGVTFAQIWADVRNLFSGRASGLIDPKDVTTDVDLFINAFVVIVAWVLQQITGESAQEYIQQALANIIVGLDAGGTTISDTDAIAALFMLLDAGSDLSGNTAIEKIEAFLKQLYKVLTGGESGFVKFFEGIKLAIQAKKAAKAAK